MPTTERCQHPRHSSPGSRVLARDPEIDLIVVIGGKKSANTKHLWEICREAKPAYLVQDAADLEPSWFNGVQVVGVTAGASTPNWLIEQVVKRLRDIGNQSNGHNGSRVN